MSDEVKLSDHPSVETQLYVMGGAINRLLDDSKDLKQQVGEIRLLQREQNGNVALSLRKIGELEYRQEAYDDWLDQQMHQDDVAKGVRTVLGIEWNIVKWVVGGGLVGAGLALGKLGNLAGIW